MLKGENGILQVIFCFPHAFFPLPKETHKYEVEDQDYGNKYNISMITFILQKWYGEIADT